MIFPPASPKPVRYWQDDNNPLINQNNKAPLRAFQSKTGLIPISVGQAEKDAHKARWWNHLETIRSSGPEFARATKGVAIDIFNTPSVNAFVDASTDFDVIDFHDGLVENIKLFFQVAFADPDLFTQWGHPEKESKKYHRLTNISWMANHDQLINTLSHQGVQPGRIPICIQRREIANMLSRISLDFIFLHEISHILYGHLELLDSLTGLRRLCEAVGPADLYVDTLQAMEIRADGFSTWQTMGRFLENVIDDSPGDTSWEHARNAVDWFILASGVVFSILASDGSGIEDHAGKSHPHPAVRLKNCRQYLFSFMRHDLGWYNYRTLQLHMDWDFTLRLLNNTCEGLGIDSSILRASTDKSIESKIEDVRKSLNDTSRAMHPSLERYSRISLRFPQGCS